MPGQWLLLWDSKDETGMAVELEPAAVKKGRPPRAYVQGPAGDHIDISVSLKQDGDYLKDAPSLKALDVSAQEGSRLAYRLLQDEAEDHYIRHEATARFCIDGDKLGGDTLDKVKNQISGRSADLLFALAVIMAAVRHDPDYPAVAATGELTPEGRLKGVGHVPAKIEAALAALPVGGLIVYPLVNDSEISPQLRQQVTGSGHRLAPIERLDEVVSQYLGIPIGKAWMGNPYRGFEKFDAQHGRIFFGREADALALEKKLLAREAEGRPGILILGASGSGKSSLTHAGLVPQLKRTQLQRPLLSSVWRPALLDEKEEAAVAVSIRNAWSLLPGLNGLTTVQPVENPPSLPRQSLSPLGQLADDFIGQLPDQARFVWVLDQLEELLTSGFAPATIDAFAKFLLKLQTNGIWIVGTFRSDFYLAYQQSPLIDVFGNGGTYDLRELDATALERIIREPARLAKLEFANDTETHENLALTLRDEVVQGGKGMLPLLEFTLSRLYEERDIATGKITFEAYRDIGGKIGGLKGAIGQHANQILATCTPKERDTLPEVLIRLIRLSDDGKQVLRQRANTTGLFVTADHETLIQKLINGRILQTEKNREGESVIELVHECLLSNWDAMQEAIGLYQTIIDQRRKFSYSATHWEVEGRPKQLLIKGKDEIIRSELLSVYMGKDVSNIECSFINESIKQSRRKNLFIVHDKVKTTGFQPVSFS